MFSRLLLVCGMGIEFWVRDSRICRYSFARVTIVRIFSWLSLVCAATSFENEDSRGSRRAASPSSLLSWSCRMSGASVAWRGGGERSSLRPRLGVRVPAPPQTSRLNVSEPLFPHLQSGREDLCLVGML